MNRTRQILKKAVVEYTIFLKNYGTIDFLFCIVVLYIHIRILRLIEKRKFS